MKPENKSFLKLLVATAFPVMLQNLLQSSLSFADTLMIGQLGEVPIAAVGVAGQIYFLIAVVIFGITSGASIFTSQYWGIKDRESIQKVMGVGLVIGLAVAAIFSYFSIFQPTLIMKIFVKEANVISEGNAYLQWVGISYLFVTVSQVLSVAIRSTGNTKTPMIVTFISMIVNLIGNYILIFPMKLGCSGAAISTTFSRLLEMVILFIYTKKKSEVGFNFKTVFSFDVQLVKKVSKTSFPVVLDDTLWALGNTVYKVVFARMGVSVLACTNVSETIQNLFFVLQIALGAGIAIIVGNEIGRDEIDNAQKHAKISIIVSLVTGLFMGALMAVTSSLLPTFFNLTDQTRELTRKALLCLSLTMPIKFLNHIVITGILRSGGDTILTLLSEIVSIWFIGVPLAFFGGLRWGLPIYTLYLVLVAEEVFKACILVPRLLGGKWIHNLTKSN